MKTHLAKLNKESVRVPQSLVFFGKHCDSRAARLELLTTYRSSVMAASSSKCSKKAFAFKKKVVEQVSIDDDDDDDDFKPSKFPFPGKVSAASVPAPTVKQTSAGKKTKGGKLNGSVSAEKLDSTNFHEKENNGKRDKGRSKADVVKRDGQVMTAKSEVKDVEESLDKQEAEVEEIILDDRIEGCDIIGVTPVSSSPGISGTAFGGAKMDGKEMWKNLMGKMQKSQENLGKVSKRAKPSTKRALVQSPKPKAISNKIKQPEQSPMKKNARLGDEVSMVTCTSLRELKLGTFESKNMAASSSQCTDESVLAANSIGKLQPNLCEKDNSKVKAPTTIAPIFLPPAERKALCKASLQTNDTVHLLDSIIDSGFESQNNNLPEDPSQFNGNTVILNDQQIDSDPYEGKKTKVCPFYKKLPGVPFCVDAFNYGLIPGMEVYFLSHFHSDHYIGLTKKFCKTIICSHPTGNLVRMKLYVEEKCIRKLHLNKTYTICDSEVTLIDANHCPGSVLFIFRFKNGMVTLHTGDFRYTPDMLVNPYLAGVRVDNLYLDTTYCSPEYDFPTQTESIANVVSHIKRHLEYRPQTLIVCGSYMIGKERVYFTLADAIGSKVYGTFDKRKIINALENRKFSSLLSADETTQIHAVPMFSITAKNLQEYLAKYSQYTNIIGIKPSGWQFSSCGSGCSVKTHYNGTVTVLGVPYSEHSSFSELKEFVTSLKPKKVQPTVNVGNPKKRGEMMKHIESWLSV